jgi:NhaA family Na+:H+ antiporter
VWQATAIAERSATRAAAFVLDHHLLLAVGAVIAMVWANTRPESYFSFAHALQFPVNHIAMTLFAALIAQEVLEAAMKGGPLHTWRRWSLPAIAALGGVLVSALVFRAYVIWRPESEPAFAEAWAAAAAIDVVFAYAAARVIFRRHAAVAFVLIAAVVTTVIGLLAVGLTMPLRVSPAAAGLMGAALALAYLLRRRHVQSVWPYLLLPGGLAWTALFVAGVHPALALVPIVPFLPHRRRSLAHFADTPESSTTPLRHMEHVWTQWVEAVLFLFALVNAGVIVQHYGGGSGGVFLASTIARPIGMLAAVGVAVLLGLTLPTSVHVRDLIVIALVCSIGFTFTLLFASVTFPVGPLLSQMRVGALASSVGIPLAFLTAWALGVGRYQSRIRRAAR